MGVYGASLARTDYTIERERGIQSESILILCTGESVSDRRASTNWGKKQ